MIVCLLTFLTHHRQALKLSPLFSDNMVLQRDAAVPVYGTATPGQTVTVSVADQTLNAKVGDDGKWMVKLAPQKAGGPYAETIQSGSDSVTIKNVMFGEVWVCSGQSNMERPESTANDYAKAMDEADPDIRMFTVGKASTEEPASALKGSWIPSSKTTVGAFSAVALAFGRELKNKLGVPVGLIHASWGGTRAEAWTGRDALASNAVLKAGLDTYIAEIRDFDVKQTAYKAALKEWVATRSDKGNEGYLQGWAQPHVFETDWKTENLPATMDTIEPIEEGKSFDGAVWFRRTFEVPDGWEGKALKLELGPIRDYDDTYVNGTKVGSTHEPSEDPALAARTYRISPGIPHKGTNSIAIRVFAAQGVCGFTGLPEQMRVSPMGEGSADPVPLAGPWFEKVERKVDTTSQAPHMPLGPGSPKSPGGLFNGMIAPLIPYGIKGFIWYQGESDAGSAKQYKILFPTLITDWRHKWGRPELPFYFVQLANFHKREDAPGDSDWAELREAQASALKLPNTAMATAIDLGEAETIHPANKREVGRRLSLIALYRDYRQSEAYRGPEYQYMVPGDGSVRVFFRHAENGLKTLDGKPIVGFAVAGEDHKFYWAEAKIQGTAVVLSNPKVPKPIAVRYGWADNPDCNLYSAEGLPTTPFRTDSWPRAVNQ